MPPLQHARIVGTSMLASLWYKGQVMQLLLTLILAHLFTDFPLQTNALARLKAQYATGVLIHVCIYMLVTALLLESFTYWPLVVSLGGTHFLIDISKAHFCKRPNGLCAFLVDQFLHLTSMIVAAYVAQMIWIPAPQGILPNDLLWSALFAASIPAGMVGCWIWMAHHEEYVNRSRSLRWLKEQLLVVEQSFGLLVVGIVFWVILMQEFGTLIW